MRPILAYTPFVLLVCALTWAAYSMGKANADRWYAKHCPQVIGWSFPRSGLCVAYAVSDKNPGQMTPVWMECPK